MSGTHFVAIDKGAYTENLLTLAVEKAPSRAGGFGW